MKLSTNLERVADQSVVIARRAKKINLFPTVPELFLLEPLYREALGIFAIVFVHLWMEIRSWLSS